ncbi:hypothetical protein [Paenibacillus tepidiphilus]|uniref:hypothetical protein n=1 Tax=Paenibacillus tepidiphilus TaxID=2608683 RepID=UPI00123B6E30|nr:hypothetical protein [Paenibacillus tepidiphilus]
MIPKPVYWIGGSACAGKSTLAKRLAAKYGLRRYACDEHADHHLRAVSPESQPVMTRISAMDMNEVFYKREVEEQLASYVEYLNEDFQLVLRDLAQMADAPVVVEGNQLLPSSVAPLLREEDRAIWLIPGEAFQREQYSRREWIHGILQATEDPEAAFGNWMRRDAWFARRVKQEAEDRKLSVLEVDGRLSLEQNLALLERHFGLSPE